MPGERDCSIWVGDLTPDVDDLQLYKFFADRFNTVRTAKGNPRISRIFLLLNFNHYTIYIKKLKIFLHNLLDRT